MTDENKESMLTTIKHLSESDIKQELVINKEEYNLLLKELYENDEFLKKKYNHYLLVPKIFYLFGVKLIII